MIPYNRQHIDQHDVNAVNATLQSDYLTQGSKIAEFESDLSKICDVNHASCVSSGTAALHLALLAMGVNSQSNVWTTAISFVATSNAALYCGAQVDFVDISYVNGCLCPDKLEEKLLTTDKGAHPDVVIVVDYGGHGAQLKEISILAGIYGFKILEDACHALGAVYDGSPIGSCEYSDATAFSFHPIKSITTGEGGAILTNNTDLDTSIKTLRTHGINQTEPALNKYSWSYAQDKIGFNYRLSDIHASLGISQLTKLKEIIGRRNELVKFYKKKLPDEIYIYEGKDTDLSAYHLLSVGMESLETLDELNSFYCHMKKNGVMVQKHYIPIYKQPFYLKLRNYKALENTEKFYIKQVSLPLFYDLDEEIILKIISVIKLFLAR